jgi:hypothetical protein
MGGMRVLGIAMVLAIGAGTMTAASEATDADKAGRVKFVKRADDICQVKRNDAQRKIARGVQHLDRHHLRRAGWDFAAAYRELRQGYRRVARLPRPHRDHKRIAKWLRREGAATATGVDAAVALQHRRLEAAARLTAKSAALERHAYAAVRKLDFKHCRPL